MQGKTKEYLSQVDEGEENVTRKKAMSIFDKAQDSGDFRDRKSYMKDVFLRTAEVEGDSSVRFANGSVVAKQRLQGESPSNVWDVQFGRQAAEAEELGNKGPLVFTLTPGKKDLASGKSLVESFVVPALADRVAYHCASKFDDKDGMMYELYPEMYIEGYEYKPRPPERPLTVETIRIKPVF